MGGRTHPGQGGEARADDENKDANLEDAEGVLKADAPLWGDAVDEERKSDDSDTNGPLVEPSYVRARSV